MKLMESDPSKRYGNLRNGSRDVFHHEWFKEVNWDMLQNRQITAPYVPNISGEGDASAYVSFIHPGALSSCRPIRRFDVYPEDNVVYGLDAPDPHGYEFPEFDYTAKNL